MAKLWDFKLSYVEKANSNSNGFTIKNRLEIEQIAITLFLGELFIRN